MSKVCVEGCLGECLDGVWRGVCGGKVSGGCQGVVWGGVWVSWGVWKGSEGSGRDVGGVRWGSEELSDRSGGFWEVW